MSVPFVVPHVDAFQLEDALLSKADMQSSTDRRKRITAITEFCLARIDVVCDDRPDHLTPGYRGRQTRSCHYFRGQSNR